MILYDDDEKIKKYKSTSEILQDFYEIRLEYYRDRKKYTLKKLKKELNILDAKVRFIMGIIDKKIVLSNQPKEKIINMLEKKNFPKYSKLSMIENTTINNTTNNTTNNIKSEKNYDYLIGMNFYSLTREKVNQLKQQHKNKDNEYTTIKKTTPENMWIHDLETFLSEYKKIYI